MADLATSLIPKRTSGGVAAFSPAAGFGAFFRIAAVIFLVSAILTGGLYFYRNLVSNNLERQKSLLKKLEIEFEPSLISELESIAGAIRAAKEILTTKNKPSKVFDILESHTLSNVSFSSFSYSRSVNSASLNGEAQSFADVYAQATIFESLPEVAGASFSNLSLRDLGSVNFALSLTFK